MSPGIYSNCMGMRNTRIQLKTNCAVDSPDSEDIVDKQKRPGFTSKHDPNHKDQHHTYSVAMLCRSMIILRLSTSPRVNLEFAGVVITYC